MGIHPVHGAADGLGSAEHLLHSPRELLGHGARRHDAGGSDDVVHGDVATVLDVLHLLSVPWGLLQCLDDKSGSRRNNRAGCLPVLDLQLDGDLKSLPVGGGLGDVVTNLLWRQTQRTHLVENKLETFEDALFESGKTSTHKTEKTGTLDLLPCGKRNAEMVEIW